jgi:hypothetical protein
LTSRSTSFSRRGVTTSDLGVELRHAIEGIEGVTILDRGSYFIAKVGETTVAYVNGRVRRFRVEAPKRDPKQRKVVVTKSREIPRAVKLVASFVPKES